MSVNEGMVIPPVFGIASGLMGALFHVAAAVVDDMEWLAHIVDSISEILLLTISNCKFDQLSVLILPFPGLPVAFHFRRIFVVGVGVNGWDVSWLENVSALELTFVKISGKNIDSFTIFKSLQGHSQKGGNAPTTNSFCHLPRQFQKLLRLWIYIGLLLCNSLKAYEMVVFHIDL